MVFALLLAILRTRFWVVCLLSGVTALLAVNAALSGLNNQLTEAMEGVDYTVTGRVVSLVRRFKYGRSFQFVIDQCELAQGPCPTARRVRLSWYGRIEQDVKPGQVWRLNLKLKRIYGSVNPDGFDSELHALKTGLHGAGYVRKKRKRDTELNWRDTALLGYRWSALTAISAARDATQLAMGRALSGFDPATRGTLVALVTGNQNAIPAPTWEVYNRTGTSHLMSISGLHVTMFAALAVALTIRLLRQNFVPTCLLTRISAPALAWMLGLAAAVSYSAFSGWGVPAQRTTLMLAVAGIALMIGRGSGPSAVLALVSAVVIVFDPWAVSSAGFWLSFGAVAAILAVSQGWIGSARTKLGDAVRTQWAATIILIPLGAVWFGSVSVISPLANAIAIPLVTGVLTPVAMIGALMAVLFPIVGAPVLWLTGWVTGWLLWLLTHLSAFNDAVWITGTPTAFALVSAVLGVIVLLRANIRLPAHCGCALTMPLLIAPVNTAKPGEWTLLAADVGQGSAILVRTARHALLFDTGPAHTANSGAGNRLIAPLLRSQRIRRLDVLVISHGDRDHIGGAATLLRRFGGPMLLTSVAKSHRLRAVASTAKNCTQGMRWRWDGVEFEFLHPGPVLMRPDRTRSNARSCVLRIRSAAGTALLTGDIERAQEKRLLLTYSPSQLKADVLIAPHHGSGTSSSSEFLDAVQPEHTVFQVGYRNRFRHPASRVIERYTKKEIKQWRTDLHGAVEFKFSQQGAATVIAHRQKSVRYWRRNGDITD
jgi:competence protein ComEC